MSSEHKKSYRQILSFLKKEFQLEIVKGKKFDLNKYSIIEKGELLKTLNIWKLTDFSFDAYLISIRNSYIIEIGGTVGESMIPREIKSKHNAVIITTEFELPELIIRPAYFKEKIANLFLNFDIKLSGRKEFNKKYVLESNSNQTELEVIITKEITNELIKHNEFSLELKKNSILLKFEKEFNQEDSINLIKIGKIIEMEIKNVRSKLF